ncbi:hypothetical protein AMTRI_Chr07g24160 [Amborella trichopoda]
MDAFFFQNGMDGSHFFKMEWMRSLFHFSPLSFFFHSLPVSTLPYSNIFPIFSSLSNIQFSLKPFLHLTFHRISFDFMGFFRLIKELVTVRKALFINRSWYGSNMFFFFSLGLS